LFGDVRASKLVIEEGATFVGKCEVNPNKASPAPLPGAVGAMRPPELVIPARK
jgi:cytoskeletal protein CcmA (bactofilin family)